MISTSQSGFVHVSSPPWKISSRSVFADEDFLSVSSSLPLMSWLIMVEYKLYFRRLYSLPYACYGRETGKVFL
ncbi:hypothetical protein TSUD_60590 [Trifolium subterraneum]|uniref:Uncharacterized protein n=1 Tax=Trifolium subterraneum TaxID=3900 RepID=A0A2Z6N5X1_TRISU|nr:hypothetical protein TSUD_60590 [Trifolium subterraneum]